MSTLIKKEGKWIQVADNIMLKADRNPDWNRAVAIPDGSTSYTAPEDGIICGGYNASYDYGIYNYYINNVLVSQSTYVGSNNRFYCSIWAMVSKGDILTANGPWGRISSGIKFVPYKLSCPETTHVTSIGDYQSIDVSTDTYTCPHTGVINFMAIIGTVGSVYVLVNGTRICDFGSSDIAGTGTAMGMSGMLFVKKGDVLTFQRSVNPPSLTANARWYND